jgi:hypothetical protein
MQPDFYHIGQYDWDFFGTLTYCPKLFYTDAFDCRIGGGKRKSAAMQLLRKIAADDNLFPRVGKDRKWNSFQWVLREETGEGWGRPHHHFLIRGITNKRLLKRPNKNNKTDKSHYLFSVENYWKKLTESIAKIRLFHKWIDGAPQYITKEANLYETQKFGDAISVEYSNAFRTRIISDKTYNTSQKELFPHSRVLTR